MRIGQNVAGDAQATDRSETGEASRRPEQPVARPEKSRPVELSALKRLGTGPASSREMSQAPRRAVTLSSTASASPRSSAQRPEAAGSAGIRQVAAKSVSDEEVRIKTPNGLEARPLTQVRDSRNFRWTGETAWRSPWLPAALNSQIKVFEPTVPAQNYDAVDPYAKDVHIKGSLSEKDILHLGLRSLEKLETSNVRFPAQWDSRTLAHIEGLRYLNINGGNAFTLTDDMHGLSQAPALRTLNLHRGEFMNSNGGEPYRHLATMTQLQSLSLDRTITLEKSPGEAATATLPDGRSIRRVTKLDPKVVESLLALINHGSLKSLSLRWCSALSPNDRERLQAAAQRKNCKITLQ